MIERQGDAKASTSIPPALADRHRRGGRIHTSLSRGSILILAVVLLSLLSVLALLIVNFVLLGTKVRNSLQASTEMLYIAEAGLAHGQAFCVAHGTDSSQLAPHMEELDEGGNSYEEDPFDVWHPFGNGEYRVRAFRLSTDTPPYLKHDSGVLLVATARLKGLGRRRVCLLLEDPPSCLPIAWWEPG